MATPIRRNVAAAGAAWSLVLASLVAAETSVVDRVEPWLALIGLRLFYELNRG